MEVDRILTALNRQGLGISRRELLKYAGIGSVAFSAAGLLAACGGDDDDDDDDDGDQEATSDSAGGSDPTATSADSSEDAEPTESESEDDDDGPTSTTGESMDGEPQQGGIWRMGLHGDPSTNVVTTPGALVDILVNKTIYNNLVQYALSDDGESILLVPDLAESWDANEDLSEFTFVIKEGVTWHDGEPFTVEDVEFTINTVLNPDNNASGRNNISSIESVEIVDERTVRFILTAPFADLPIMLGYNRPMFPKHLLEGADFENPTEFLANPVGTGPFRFVELVQGSHMATEAYEDYFEGRPLMDGIYFGVIPDGNTRVAQLLAGDIDFTVIEPAQLEAVEDNDDIEVRFTPQVNYFFFAINHSLEKFADVRVRQALVHAIDRQAVIDNILQGAGTLSVGPINPLLGDFYDPTIVPYEFDMDQAAALLEEAGWTKDSDGNLTNADGETFTILFNGPSINPIMVQVIQYAEQQYSELGFDVTLDIVDWPVHLDKYREGGYDLLMEWWITPPSPDQFSHYHTDGNNWWNYSNPEVDDLITQARTEPDYDRRVELYHQLSQALHEDVPIVYLYHPQEVQAMRRTHDLPFIGYRDALTWMEIVWVES